VEEAMKTNRPDSLLKKFPSWILAICTLIGATIVLFGVGECTEQFDRVGYIPYMLNGLIIAACCFFIIRVNPKSVFYVPLMSNAMTILSALVERNFWHTPMWIPICGGWVLTLIASIVAARIGKRDASLAKT
jgi:uncharacterized membrane protein